MSDPKPAEIWKHRNGNQYAIVTISNLNTERPEQYPITVVYQNIHNWTIWSRPLSDWHRSMTIVPPSISIDDIDPATKAQIEADVLRRVADECEKVSVGSVYISELREEANEIMEKAYA